MQPSFPYYDKPLAVGGVIVQMAYDVAAITRTVYSISDWLGVVGGFMGTMQLIF